MNTISNFFLNFFTRDNLTLLLALIGTAGTIYTFMTQRLNVKVTALNLRSNPFLLELQFENLSSIPVSITHIKLKIGKEEYTLPRASFIAVPDQKMPREYQAHQRNAIYTLDFPVRLESFGALRGYIGFPLKSKLSVQKANKLLPFRQR